MISQELIVGKVDESTLMFDKNSIYKITDDRGKIVYSSNKNLINTKELSKNIGGFMTERQDNPVVNIIQTGVQTIVLNCILFFIIIALIF
jgi:hypothetical protein